MDDSLLPNFSSFVCQRERCAIRVHSGKVVGDGPGDWYPQQFTLRRLHNVGSSTQRDPGWFCIVSCAAVQQYADRTRQGVPACIPYHEIWQTVAVQICSNYANSCKVSAIDQGLSKGSITVTKKNCRCCDSTAAAKGVALVGDSNVEFAVAVKVRNGERRCSYTARIVSDR